MTSLKMDENVLKNPLLEGSVQFLPFSIKFNGETQICERFSSQTQHSKQKQCLVNTFRGYPLEGEVLQAPAGYTGVVLDLSLIHI